MIYGHSKISLSGTFAPTVVFLAEGATEQHFIDKALQGLRAPVNDCAVFSLDGYSQLKNKIRNIMKEPNFEKVSALGIMLDADDHPESRLRPAAIALGLANFPSDEDALRNDYLCLHGPKKAGVFVSPGNGEKGQIETLVIEEIQTTKFFECLTDYEACIKKISGRLDAKGFVQGYISTRKGSLCGVGRAFEAGILDVNHRAYEGAREFIQQLL